MECLDTSFLQNDEIKLVLDKFYPGNLAINWVPAYSFYICDLKENKMGKCDLRIGNNEGLFYGGHIGYTINKEYRGHHYSAKACKLLFKLAKKHDMEYLYITANPDNHASNTICEYF